MIEVLQVESELESMLALYERRKPRKVLEIGSWEGGTLREWLTGGRPPARVVAVDLHHRNPQLYGDWCQEGTDLVVIEGDSTSDEVKEKVRELGPYNWMFVDGDHGWGPVNSDVALAMECAAPKAVLLMHDIARGVLNEGDPSPWRVFDELRASYRTEEFVEHPYYGNWAHGIGVVYL